MWKRYFGPQCRIYGVDIEAACKAYEDETVQVFVGDQADRSFWKSFKEQVPFVDIIIDDGGHKSAQQIVTLEELLPHLRPGGVYLCEDMHGEFNGFACYINGFSHHLSACGASPDNGSKDRQACKATPFQSAIHSVHLYPYVTVIEKTDAPIAEFAAPKHGTQWQPFFD